MKNRQTRTYTIKNRNEAERVVLVEHPVNHAFRLVGEEPPETAGDAHRFEAGVPAGKTRALVVAGEREGFNRYAIPTRPGGQIGPS